MNLIESIDKYEAGDMTEEEVIEFFQWLVNSGCIYHLQGTYQRTAQDLIDAELVKVPFLTDQGSVQWR